MPADEYICTDTNREMGIIYFDYILPVAYCMGAICLIPPTYIYVRSYIRESKQQQKGKYLFYFGLILLIAVLLLFIMMIMIQIHLCHNFDLSIKLTMIFLLIHLFQSEIFLIILFMRVWTVFNDKSPFRLSRFTIIVFIISCFIAITIRIFGAVSFVNGRSMSFTLTFLGIPNFLWIIQVIWINGLFVHKLIKTRKLCQDENNATRLQITDIITKFCVLCIVSSLGTLITVINLLVQYRLNSPIHYFFVVNFILIANLYTNVLCLLFSYIHFDPLYRKICGRCHNKYQSLWTYRSRNEESEIMMQVHQRPTTTTSKNDDDTSTGTKSTTIPTQRALSTHLKMNSDGTTSNDDVCTEMEMTEPKETESKTIKIVTRQSEIEESK